MHLIKSIKSLREALFKALEERDKLQAFKDGVHKWLDNNGVPSDPNPERNANPGCQIGCRLEWLAGHRTHPAIAACKVLAAIADAYDDNALDDEARKIRGMNDESENTTPPERIELYCGRGGKRLLTLADCFAARDALASLDTSKEGPP